MTTLTLTIKQEDLTSLFSKGIFQRLEEGSFYYVNVIITTRFDHSSSDYLFDFPSNTAILRWSFPWKNDLDICETQWINLINVIELLLERYQKPFETTIDLEFTKVK